MARRVRRGRKRGRARSIVTLVVALAVVGFFRDTWLGWFIPDQGGGPIVDVPDFAPPILATDRPEDARLDGGPHADVTERGSDPLLLASPSTSPRDPEKAAALLASAGRALEQKDPVLARAHFSEAVTAGLPPKDELAARTELRRLGRRTIFSGAVEPGDPFAAYYVLVPGDTLSKVASAHDVTAELLARINNIADVNRITAGRRIKTIRGPFHARVTKSTFTLDVFLGDTLVDHFKVGLGAEGATPTGQWRVNSKLKNPTYYSPRGQGIISAGDPKNPLAERWLGLEGIAGEALGQMRYGIHGTIEPESIGKNASLGCIRMHNKDVEVLFDLLIAGKSTVEVRD